MNKFKLILIVLLFGIQLSYSMSVLRSVSIIWRMDKKVKVGDEIYDSIPYLRIKYTNINQYKGVYFYHDFKYNGDESFINFYNHYHTTINYNRFSGTCIADSIGSESGNIFNVLSRQKPNFSNFQWQILNTNSPKKSKKNDDIDLLIKDKINDLSELLLYQFKFNNSDSVVYINELSCQKGYHLPFKEVINRIDPYKEEYENQIKYSKFNLPEFVFIEPDSFYTEEYNLLPFFIFGGNYRFMLFQEKLKGNTVYSQISKNYNENQNTIFRKPKRQKKRMKVLFPIEYNGYKLQKGQLNSSEILFGNTL